MTWAPAGAIRVIGWRLAANCRMSLPTTTSCGAVCSQWQCVRQLDKSAEATLRPRRAMSGSRGDCWRRSVIRPEICRGLRLLQRQRRSPDLLQIARCSKAARYRSSSIDGLMSKRRHGRGGRPDFLESRYSWQNAGESERFRAELIPVNSDEPRAGHRR